MKNNIFVFSKDKNKNIINFKRFHICTWEFRDESALIEIGGEIIQNEDLNEDINIDIYIPWLSKDNKIKDLFESLIDPENSKLIFNEPTPDKKYVHKDDKKLGMIMDFTEQRSICLIPIKKYEIENNILNININAHGFHELYYNNGKKDVNPNKNIDTDKKPNLYFRFYIETSAKNLTIRKNGMNKTSIIYDFQINEIRNKPKQISIDDYFCKIEQCYLINIIPNSYEVSFYDSKNLKNIRTLEEDLFKVYLNNKLIEKDDLIVVFNKNSSQKPINSNSSLLELNINENHKDNLKQKNSQKNIYFFIKYQKETIGAAQVFIAVWINFICQISIWVFSPIIENKRLIIITSLIIMIITPILLFSKKLKNLLYKLKSRNKK